MENIIHYTERKGLTATVQALLVLEQFVAVLTAGGCRRTDWGKQMTV